MTLEEHPRAGWKAPALRLIDAAERLFGQHGIDGVSMIEVGRAAGQANKYATQYHFGTKENLIRAIFETRLARIEVRHQVLLDKLMGNAMTVTNLLTVLFRPIYDEIGPDGLHHFARFARRAVDSSLAREIWLNSEGVTTGVKVIEMLSEMTPHLSPEQFMMRMSLLTELQLGALDLIDRMTLAKGTESASAWHSIASEEVFAQAIRASQCILE